MVLSKFPTIADFLASLEPEKSYYFVCLPDGSYRSLPKEEAGRVPFQGGFNTLVNDMEISVLGGLVVMNDRGIIENISEYMNGRLALQVAPQQVGLSRPLAMARVGEASVTMRNLIMKPQVKDLFTTKGLVMLSLSRFVVSPSDDGHFESCGFIVAFFAEAMVNLIGTQTMQDAQLLYRNMDGVKAKVIMNMKSRVEEESAGGEFFVDQCYRSFFFLESTLNITAANMSDVHSPSIVNLLSDRSIEQYRDRNSNMTFLKFARYAYRLSNYKADHMYKSKFIVAFYVQPNVEYVGCSTRAEADMVYRGFGDAGSRVLMDMSTRNVLSSSGPFFKKCQDGFNAWFLQMEFRKIDASVSLVL